jgi:hypothetical protein
VNSSSTGKIFSVRPSSVWSLLDVGEATGLLAREDLFPRKPHLEDAPFGVGHEGDALEVLLEGGEQLLGHPGRP